MASFRAQTRRQVGITGGKEVAAFLKRYGPKVEANIMRGAMVAGAKVIRDKAREKAKGLDIEPEAKKRLARAIRHKRSRSRPGKVVAGVFVASIPKKDPDTKSVAAVGSKGRRDDPKVWWRWFEYGTKDRWTGTRGRGKRKRRVNTNKRVYRGKINAQPFFRPAFDEAHGAAIEAVVKYAKKRVEEEADKLTKVAHR